ncbi:malate dehydrogenase [Oxynema sp. CENA135]|uniref:malate dehydrogenase n=1 Tax=Oxynema sp. CENA135 TaxID=984206 RepID=UPI0019093D74|nr:malate dehydrogenase [Oxynema sp. CENA135]MBK4728300.1 malate dehydrogenase [Oxynema sp. CENA135]
MNSTAFTPPTCHRPRVAVIGAGRVGSTLAQRIIEKNLADVVLLDVVEGWPQGIALDLMEARGVERHDRAIVGTNDYADTANADVVVVTAGRPRRPGMNRDDLIVTNAQIVAGATEQAIARSPNAIVLVVTNPLDVMTYVAWEKSGLPARRVVGMAGVLDAARFKTFISMELGVSIREIDAMVLGDHGQLMVPLPRYCTVNGIPLTELMDDRAIDRLVERTRHGGTEIVELMKTASAYFAPASAACAMVEAILRDESRILPGAAYLEGEYGLNDLFLGVPCQLGCRGVEKIVELQLDSAEREAFEASAKSVAARIHKAKELLSDKI